jgi:hypothetical protein
LNKTEVVGLDRFLDTLDRRKDVEGRERGLITGMVLVRTLQIEGCTDGFAPNSIEPCLCVCSTPCNFEMFRLN